MGRAVFQSARPASRANSRVSTGRMRLPPASRLYRMDSYRSRQSGLPAKRVSRYDSTAVR